MIAKTIKGQSTEDISAALQRAIAENFKPTLAVVFISIKQDSDAVCKLLEEKGISIFGATTSGEFINNEISEGGIVIMLLDINPAYFRLLFLETSYSSAYDTAKQLGTEGKNLFDSPAFIIVSGWLHTEGENIIKGIEDGFGGPVTVFGGMAGDDLTLKDPRVFTSGKNSTTGILAMIIDGDKVNVSGVATCGWRPIGIIKTITKSNGNVVYTIDDQPAFDLVIKYLGLNIDEMNAITNTVVNLGAYYPLQLEREDAPAVMRTAMLGNKEDRSLICAGNVPQGSKVRFSLPPDFDVIDTVVNECSELKDEKQNDADALIMFSCISRYLSFGVMTGEELERVQKVWNAPFIGFFSYGEFGKSKIGKHEFHNNTCCVVTLKEK
ncbi:MAG: FIST C-terminal domain-containing protein [Chitinophagaceae bacterium]|nr:FIST C-terminal domain-containing protein [Chitinophagaceae bacterium]